MISITAIYTALFLFLWVMTGSGELRSEAKEPVIDSEERSMVEMINEYRREHGLEGLQVSVTLTRAADWMTNDMAKNNIFGHTDSLGRDPGERIVSFGYSNRFYRGENLAAGFGDAKRTFKQWLDSPPHNAAMLHPKFKAIGISRYKDDSSEYKWYWASDFGGYVDKTFVAGN
ncbi:MAG: CAP domain-containing protein [Blastocatellia bacterium]|nr:CAP domain-containing protein [Blastocatellia bacterium]